MTMITRRSLVLGSLVAPFAQSAPALTATGNITRIVVPFPPGGTVDPIARLAQPGLQVWNSAPPSSSKTSRAPPAALALRKSQSPRRTAATGCSCSTPMRSTRSFKIFHLTPKRTSNRCC